MYRPALTSHGVSEESSTRLGDLTFLERGPRIHKDAGTFGVQIIGLLHFPENVALCESKCMAFS